MIEAASVRSNLANWQAQSPKFWRHAASIERWGWARNYVNKMIAAAEVTTSLGTTVPAPATERQARPLTKLPADEQADANMYSLGYKATTLG